MMKFSIALDLKTGLGFQFSTGFRLKDQCASLRFAHKIFQKKKKEKKESHSFKWRVSKKQVFLIKYYPIGWRFYQKPEARTCFFVNLELTFAFFFFIFCFDFINQSSSYNRKFF